MDAEKTSLPTPTGFFHRGIGIPLAVPDAMQIPPR
jgi:hypothetical protein